MPGITLTRAGLVGLFAVGYYYIWHFSWPYFSPAIDAVMESGLLPDGTPLKTKYTGIGAIDEFLTITTAFFWGSLNDNRGRLHLGEFLSSISVGVAIMLVESYKADAGILQKIPSVWGMFTQMKAAGVAYPLYFAASLDENSPPNKKPISAENARGILPAILLGYVAPSILMLVGPDEFTGEQLQGLMATWQFFPIYVSILAPVFSTIMPRYGNSKGWMQFNYVVLTFICLEARIAVLMATAISSHFSFSNIFMPATWEGESLLHGTRMFLQYDYFFAGAAMAIWGAVVLGRELGDLKKGFALLLPAAVVVGPGAAVGGMMAWREDRESRLKAAEEAERSKKLQPPPKEPVYKKYD